LSNSSLSSRLYTKNNPRAYRIAGAEDVRVISYDDRNHHPEIETHPHPMYKEPEPPEGIRDLAFPCALSPLNFSAVFQSIVKRFE
jgi:hypothetical protein